MLRIVPFACVLLLVGGRAGAQTASLGDLAPTDGNQAASPASATAPTIYFAADELPTFPGGDAAMLKFLSSRLNYPAAALDRNLSGKVYLTFVVDPEGRLHDPHVVRGLGAGLDEEALRLVRLMPWWTPGKIHGQPVWVSVTMPIAFRAL